MSATEQLLARIDKLIKSATNDQPLLLTAQEAARLLGCSRSTLYTRVATGEAPAPVVTTWGHRWRREDLERFVRHLPKAEGGAS